MSKKKILLLSDDLRMHSGIATMSRELVLGTVHHYDWVQIAGAIKHPEANKVVDLSQATRDMVKVPDAYVKLYPTDGYGNDQMLFAVIVPVSVGLALITTFPVPVIALDTSPSDALVNTA